MTSNLIMCSSLRARRRRAWQSSTNSCDLSSFVLLAGDCFVASRLAMTFNFIWFVLTPGMNSDSSGGHCDPDEGGRSNPKLPSTELSYLRRFAPRNDPKFYKFRLTPFTNPVVGHTWGDCFVASLLAMTFNSIWFVLTPVMNSDSWGGHCDPDEGGRSNPQLP